LSYSENKKDDFLGHSVESLGLLVVIWCLHCCMCIMHSSTLQTSPHSALHVCTGLVCIHTGIETTGQALRQRDSENIMASAVHILRRNSKVIVQDHKICQHLVKVFGIKTR